VIIGVIGCRLSGKSTFGEYLVENKSFKRLPMAAPIKQMLRSGLGLTKAHTDGELKQIPCDELCGMTPVHAMQTLGTEWGRNLMGKDIWLNRWSALCPKYDRVIADDVRFSNEMAAIKSKGGIIIRTRRTAVEGRDSHESEIYALQFKPDYEIRNDGTVEEFKNKIDALLSDLKIT